MGCSAALVVGKGNSYKCDFTPSPIPRNTRQLVCLEMSNPGGLLFLSAILSADALVSVPLQKEQLTL